MSAFTPLIKPLNQQGTTFYTFSSAARDLSKCLANSQKEFVFSHFVCLDIPDIINVANWNHSDGSTSNESSETHSDRNYFQLCAIDDMLDRCFADDGLSHPTIKSSSQLIAELLQDYVYNFEETLLDISQDNTTDRSVAERVFWHFLKETGAINWKYDAAKLSPSLIQNNEVRYVEGNPDVTYSSVVRYIGNIDITNNVDIANEAYTEIYVHIPSEVGCTPVTLFKQVTDNNLDAGQGYEVVLNQEYIRGQSGPDSANPVDLRALYDTRNGNQYMYVMSGTTGTNVTTTHGGNTTHGATWNSDYYKTDLDCLCIDFDANSYADITLNGYSSIDEFNKSPNASSFQFNTVLVYYDIVDVSSGTRTPNLYGILFLDDAKSMHPGWDYLQRYPKYKPVTGVQNGNSYGFKLNFRIDIEPNKQGVTTLVNEYNTFSMSLFADAMTRLTECTDMFTRTRGAISRLESKVNDIETFLTTISDYNNLVEAVNDLTQTVENANMAFADRNTLIELIARNWDAINSIVNGTANVELQYNTDVVRAGYNVDIDTNTPNVIKVNSKNFGYAIGKTTLSDGSVTDIDNPIDLTGSTRGDNDVNFHLNPSTNMVRIYTDPSTPAAFDIVINALDTITTWKTGQNIRVVFPNLTAVRLNGYNIVFRTNFINGTNSNSVVSVIVRPEDLIGDRPIIEFTCTDNTFTSSSCIVYDVLR